MKKQERPHRVAARMRPDQPLKSGFNKTTQKNRNSIGETGQSFSTSDAIGEFKTAMLKLGLLPPASLIADGKIHRCGTASRERGKDGAYCLYLNSSVPAGWFQNHRTGAWQTWSLKTNRLRTLAEQTALYERITQDRLHYETEISRQYDRTAIRAERLLNAMKPADDTHEYLSRKGVKAYGVREWLGRLVIPVYNSFGRFQSLQFISPDGSKRFLSGGKLTGGRFLIGREPSQEGVILIGEGYATMATIHAETSHPCFVAFSASNLEHVALSIRAFYPKAKIVITADNDWQTAQKIDRNPGIEAARRAAASCRGNIVFPPELPDVSDFNDYAQHLKMVHAHE